MNVVSIAWLFGIISLMYILAQLIVIGVAVYFWRRYPRPSLYLAIMATLEVGGSLMQNAIQFMLNWGTMQTTNLLLVQIMGASIRFVAHILAMCFLVAAVYVARRPSTVVSQGILSTTGTPGMEGGDRANALDPANPYTPPRQPR